MSRGFPLLKLGLKKKHQSYTKPVNIPFSEMPFSSKRKIKKTFFTIYIFIASLRNKDLEASTVLCSVVKQTGSV